MSSPANDFDYDVFISYRHQEPTKTWVRETLVPALEARGVKVLIDHRDFRIGYQLTKEMARAVEKSRYTLAVITPEYLESAFVDVENVMAEHLGLERKERRLMAIKRERAQMRLGMRTRLALDMTNDATFDADVDKLAQALLQPPDLD